jgi:AcrR family transcriptional regulator
VFAVTGYHGASLRAIARSAGIDHSTLLHHFSDKTALLLAVLAQRDEVAADVLGYPWPDAEHLRDGLERLIDANRSVPGLVQMFGVVSAEAASEGHPARPYFQDRSRRLVEVLEEAFRRFRTEESSVPDERLHEAAIAFIALWEGLQLFDELNPGAVDLAGTLDRELARIIGL